MALKPCKECKKEVAATAKSCPHCGVTNPGMSTAKGCLVLIILSILIAFILSMCSDDTSSPAKIEKSQAAKQTAIPEQSPEAKQTYKPTLTMDEATRNNLIVEMTNFYIASFYELVSRHNAYKDRDRSVFINWRNQEWVPKYRDQKSHFENVLSQYGISTIDTDFLPIKVALGDLELASLDIMRSIRDNDRKFFSKGVERGKESLMRIEPIITDKKLESRITVPEL